MTESKRPLKVFLCHAHADRDAVRALYTRLTNDGVDAWLDKEKLLPGQDWELEIKKAVREADVVVVCLSNQFNQRGFRQKEVRLALDTAMEMPEGEIFIIPARLEECENLESLRRWHWVDLFENGGYERLIRALRARANNIGATLQIKIDEQAKISTDAKKETISQEKIAQEFQREREKLIRKAKRDFWWEKIKIDIRYRFQVIYIYRVPILILLVTLAFITPLLIRLSNLIPEVITTLNKTPTATIGSTLAPQSITNSTEAFIPLEALTPSLTSTEVFVITPTSLPTEITDAKGVSMVLVPEGKFSMGADDKDYPASRPMHEVYLNSFYIDTYEVTNALYKLCVDDAMCAPPEFVYSHARSSYYENNQFNDYPVIYVSWYQAEAFCNWRESRLPTEAEWEKAARGINSYRYPWGNTIWDDVDCTRGNYRGCGVGDTTKIGIYEDGKSPYGIYDMAGNVMEWVADYYSEEYYAESPLLNPLGIVSGTDRVIRGGSWSTEITLPYAFRRFSLNPFTANDTVGFRCARDTNP